MLNTYIKETNVNVYFATDSIRYFKSFNAKILKYKNERIDSNNVSINELVDIAEDFVLFNTSSIIDMSDSYCSHNMFSIYVAMYMYIQINISNNLIDDDIDEVYFNVKNLITKS